MAQSSRSNRCDSVALINFIPTEKKWHELHTASESEGIFMFLCWIELRDKWKNVIGGLKLKYVNWVTSSRCVILNNLIT